MADGKKILGPDRNGEGPLWKLLRLWPVVLAIVAVATAWGSFSSDVKSLEAGQTAQWKSIGDNRDQIQLLKQQGARVENELDNINRAIGSQREGTKEILRELRK